MIPSLHGRTSEKKIDLYVQHPLYSTQRVELIRWFDALMHKRFVNDYTGQNHLRQRVGSCHAVQRSRQPEQCTRTLRSPEGGLAPALLPASRTWTNPSFSTHGGTAGQQWLNIIDTTIKCPTKVSHFWDGWDTFGTHTGRNATVRERASTLSMSSAESLGCIGARSFTVGFLPVIFPGTAGHGTNLGRTPI